MRRDPGSTDFQRGLSVSYERLGDLAGAAGQTGDAERHIDAAVDARTALHQREPRNVALAEELTVTLRQRISIIEQIEPDRSTILTALEPLEHQGLLTEKGLAMLAWVRSLDDPA